MPRHSPVSPEPSAVAGALGDDGWTELEFGVLGTSALVAVRGGGPGLLIEARQQVDEIDQRWNPHRADGLVAELDRATGAPVPVDEDTFDLVERSLAAFEQTGGLVGSEGVTLNAVLTRVTVPEEATLDLDDLAWARAADLVAEALVEAGADGAVVDIGGVLRLAGTAGESGVWVVEIPDPDDEVPLASIGLADGAVATFARPTAGLRSVTVLAPDAATAVVLAAAADAGLIEASGQPGLLVATDGTQQRFGAIDDYLR